MRPAPLLALALLAALAAPARAHEGPPFPILVDETVGPYLVSVWADPDIGVGTFYVMLDPVQGRELPAGTRASVEVTPADGSGPTRTVAGAAVDGGGATAQFEALVEFPVGALWDVVVRVDGDAGGGALEAQVESTPPGYGSIDLLWFAGPFLLLGVLWIYGLQRRRRALAALASAPEDPSRPCAPPTRSDRPAESARR